MSASNRTSIVLFIMQSLRDAGSWCGETHIQKTVFLCQELIDVEFDFKFILYKHGPYSFDLSEYLQRLISDDFIHIISRPPYGPSLYVHESVKRLAGSIAEDANLSAKITFVSQRLSKKGVADLEKIATAAFVNKKYGTEEPIKKRAEILNSLKPHVSQDAARQALSEFESLELEARTI